MKCALFSLSLFLFSTSVRAHECVVISGHEKDHNNALTNEILRRDMDYGKFHCKVFPSWEDAAKFLKSTPNLKPGRVPKDQLLIIQGAHGSKGGDAACNAKDIDGDTILSYLEKYSRTYQVGAIIKSCFSGDLLAKKLKSDYVTEDPAQIANLCLVTASQFGKLAWGGLIDYDPKPGVSLEDFHRLYGFGKGFISSSAWDTAGVPEFLVEEDVARANKTFQGLSKVISYRNGCSAAAVEGLKLCRASQMTSELWDTLSRFQGAIRGSEQTVKDRYELLNTYLEKGDPNQSQFVFDLETEKAKKNCYSASRDLMSAVLTESSMRVGKGVDAFEILREKWPRFVEQGLLATCQDYQKKLQGSRAKGFPVMVGSGVGGAGGFGSEPTDASSLLGLKDAGLEFEILGQVLSNWQLHQSDLEVLKKNFKEFNEKKVSAEVLFSQLDNHQALTCEEENENRKYILSKILGKHLFQWEEDEMKPGYNGPSLTLKATGQEIMSGFTEASTQMSDSDLSAVDQKRRKACRDFKF